MTPDKEAFYKEQWSHEKELREAFQRANAHLAREIRNTPRP